MALPQNQAADRLGHALNPRSVDKTPAEMRVYTVNRLGRAANIITELGGDLEELMAKVTKCQRQIGAWNSPEVKRALTEETHHELLQDVATIRARFQGLFKQLAIRGPMAR